MPFKFCSECQCNVKALTLLPSPLVSCHLTSVRIFFWRIRLSSWWSFRIGRRCASRHWERHPHYYRISGWNGSISCCSYQRFACMLPLSEYYTNYPLISGWQGASLLSDDLLEVIILIQFFLECLFRLLRVLFILAVDIVQSFHCRLVASAYLDLLVGCFLLTLLLFLVKFNQLLFQFQWLLPLVLTLLTLLFVVSSIDLLQMLLVLFRLLSLLLLYLSSVRLVFLKVGFDFFLVFLAGIGILHFLPSKEVVLVFWLLNGVVYLVFLVLIGKWVPSAMRRTTIDLLVACGSSWKLWSAKWEDRYSWCKYQLCWVFSLGIVRKIDLLWCS